MEHKENKFASYYFILQGVGVLASWNATLTALDFFRSRFEGYDVDFYLPIPFMLGNIIFATIIIFYSSIQNLNKRIISSIFLTCILMILLAVSAAVFPNTFGFYLCLGIAFMLGSVGSVFNSSSNGLVTMFPGKYVAKFFFGTGLSGLTMNFLGLAFNLIFGKDKKGIVISSMSYFSVAAFFLIVCFLLFR